MVNKTAVGLLGVVVLASLGVGILIGMQLGGGGDAPTATVPTTDSSTATATPTGHQTAANPSGTATPSTTPTDRQTTIPARQFDEGEIAARLATLVNEERQERNRSSLGTGGKTASRVAAMAVNHSVAMADNGAVAHTVDGVSTRNRYENNDLFERCKFKSPEGSYISQPDEDFELIGSTKAGTRYQDDGEERFNGDEQSVARALVDGWLEDEENTERLLVRGPTRMGVGVEVTAGGTVYATVAVCA